MAEQDAQRSMAERAYQLAIGVEKHVTLLDERMTRHELDCLEERRQATKQRHDFRAEMSLTLGAFRDEMTRGLQVIQSRINAGLVLVIMTLLGTTGFLFIRAMDWI